MPRPLRIRWPAWILLFLIACLAGLSGLPSRAADEAPLDENVKKIYHRLLRSSLWVARPKGEPGQWGTGTGALIDVNRRLVLTNWHVVTDQDVVFVCFPTYQGPTLVSDRKFYLNVLGKGGGGRGKVIARDIPRDLAVIQMDVLPGGTISLPLAAEGAKPGDRVHSIGNPGASDQLWVCTSRTVHEVAFKKIKSINPGLDHTLEAWVVLAETPGKQGESGGPLVNDKGELVGVTQGSMHDLGLRVYIDLREVKDVLKSKGLLPKAAPPPPVVTPNPTVKEPAKPPDKPADKPEDIGQEADRRLRFAKLLIDGGKQQRGREVLEEIIQTYPSTEAAREAKRLLEKKN